MTIDQELQAALDVDPSPEFVARVRIRIATAPALRRWNAWWMVSAGALSTAIVAFAVLVMRPAPQSGEQAVVASRALPATALPLVEPSVALAVPLRNLAQPRALAVPRNVGAQGSNLVLLDPRETAALQRLIYGGGSGRLATALWLRPSPLAVAEPATFVDLEIPELVIEPLPIGSEGARQ